MNIKDSQLYFLEESCINKFGIEKGNNIFKTTEQEYKKLCDKANFRNNKAIKEHMLKNLYPTMAYYKALLIHNYESNEAICLVKCETAKSALDKKRKQQIITKIPRTYFWYRLLIKSIIRKKYPTEGWETKWILNNKNEIHFDFSKCLYKDICDEEKCPELCKVFCANDDIAFSGLLPKIRFARNGTLGTGEKYCDFHFIKNKNI